MYNTNLLELCIKLVKYSEATGDTKADIAAYLEEFFASSGFKVADVAKALGITDQAIYRWLRSEAKPRPTYMKRLRLLVEEKLASQSQRPPRLLRIGVPPTWDAALITAFEPFFGSHNVRPQFVSVTAVYEGVHRAFQDGRIDIAIHHHFLTKYDQELKELNDPACQNLTMRYPLFVFNGFYIYVRRGAVERVLQTSDSGLEKEGRNALQEMLAGRWTAAMPKAKANAQRAILRTCYVGVERGTGFDLAFRSAYKHSGLDFEAHACVNLRNDVNFSLPINGDGDAYYADTADAFSAFLEGSVDLFCGGLAHHRYLQHHGSSQARHAVGSDGGEFMVLFRPEELQVQSYCGIVAPESLNDDLVDITARIWQAGMAAFSHWSDKIDTADEDAKTLAYIQLSALFRVTETYVPPKLQIMNYNLTASARWTAWIRQWIAGLRGKGTERLQDDEHEAGRLAKQAIDYYRRDWRIRVKEWVSLLNEHCQFLTSFGEAQSAYARRYNEFGEDQGVLLMEQMALMVGELARRHGTLSDRWTFSDESTGAESERLELVGPD